MNKKVCLYRVQICNSPNSYYYLASDINAIFERKFDYYLKSVEFLDDELIGICNEHDKDKKLFYVTLTSESSFYIVANDMKEAYKLLHGEIESRICFLNTIDYIAPVQYVKSFQEMDNEVEAMRIG